MGICAAFMGENYVSIYVVLRPYFHVRKNRHLQYVKK